MYWRRKRWKIWILSPAVIDMSHSAISGSNCRSWSLPISPSYFWWGQRKPSDSSPLQLISPLVNCHIYSKLEESPSSWKTKVPFTGWCYPPAHSTAETPVQNCLPVTETQAGDILPLLQEHQSARVILNALLPLLLPQQPLLLWLYCCPSR